MNESMIYALIPTGAALIGGLLSYLFSPRPLLMTFLFSLAAGLIISALVVEFVPNLIESYERIPILLSFLVGAAAMLLMDILFFQLEKFSTFSSMVALSLAFIINGILISLAFFISQKAGIVMALSASFSLLLLNFIMMNRVRNKGWRPFMRIITLIFIVVMIPLGSWLGSYLLGSTHHFARIEMIAFITALYLYFGMRELICELQGRKECWLSLLGFFGGLAAPFLLR